MSRRRKIIIAIAIVVSLPFFAHFGLVWWTEMAPPPLSLDAREVKQAEDDTTRREIGRSWARMRGTIREARLEGSPAEVGDANVRLLYDDQTAIEHHLHDQFAEYVPLWPARVLLVDLARLRFRDLDERLEPDHRLEIAAQARAFDPDPFSSLMGTYQRFVFLHSLYDIMLSFERSPLVGCTSFAIGKARTANGHVLLGRNFDFEGPQILDERKAVFLMREDGHIPYASVSWPGFVGVMSGMNIDGLAIVIHGARAGESNPHGDPVVHTVRRLLRKARTTREALALLADSDPMVPHMLLITDAHDDAVAVERVPGRPLHLRNTATGVLPLTNHLEGPDAADPKNQTVLSETSTLPRRQRLDTLLDEVQQAAVSEAITILRDKGDGLPMGHRHAIDALIATHSVVFDVTDRAVWVNEGPHATGRYVRFDLRELLADDYMPRGPADVVSLPADPIASDGRLDAWREAGQPHPGSE